MFASLFFGFWTLAFVGTIIARLLRSEPFDAAEEKALAKIFLAASVCAILTSIDWSKIP